MNGVTLAVREHLNLDMAGILQILLQIEGVVTESRCCFAARQRYGVEQRRFAVHDAHAAAATPARCLDDHRIAQVACNAQGFIVIVTDGAVRTWHARHTRSLHLRDGRHLVAHHADGLRPRSDENETALLDAFGKIGVLGKKAVAGMNGDRVGDLGGAHHRRNIEVAFRRRRWTDAHRLVGEAHVLEIAIGGRVHGDGLDAELATGAQNTQSDFTAVGDDQLTENGHQSNLAATRRWRNGLPGVGSRIFVADDE